jgi:hypothetical protein
MVSMHAATHQSFRQAAHCSRDVKRLWYQHSGKDHQNGLLHESATASPGLKTVQPLLEAFNASILL